jgi:peptide/nickel transport system substrate-binding protein
MAAGHSSGTQPTGTGLSRRTFAAIVSAALLFAACQSQQPSANPTTGPNGSPAPAPTAGASEPSGELVAAVGNTGTHQWAPHLAGDDTAAMYKFMHDSLTQVDKDSGQIVPMLAESWSLSDDGLTWTWKLRDDVVFQDGWGPLTSEDVKFTWGEWMRDDSNQNVAETLAEIVDGNIDNIEIVSPTEFKIHTPRPYTTLDSFFAQSFARLYITSKKYHEEKGEEAANHPIGTGPWKFVSSNPGVDVVMEANTDYWGQVPAFEKLTVKEIPDGSARLVQLQSGAVDIANLPSDLIGEADAAGIEIESVKDIGTVQMILGGQYYGHPNLDADSPWIQADAPEKGKACREALSLAIDRQLIIDRVLRGEATANYGPLLQYNANPELNDPSWTLPEYNVEKAKQKLAECGYPDGFPITLFEYPDDVDTVGIAQAVAGMWQEIGVQVTQEQGEEDILDEKLNAAETDGMAFVKLQGFDPPDVTLINYLSSEDDDYKFFYKPLDDAYAAYTSEPDPAKRWQIIRDLITSMRDDVIAVPLFTANLPVGIGPKIGSWEPTPGDKDMNSLETVLPAQ